MMYVGPIPRPPLPPLLPPLRRRRARQQMADGSEERGARGEVKQRAALPTFRNAPFPPDPPRRAPSPRLVSVIPRGEEQHAGGEQRIGRYRAGSDCGGRGAGERVKVAMSQERSIARGRLGQSNACDTGSVPALRALSLGERRNGGGDGNPSRRAQHPAMIDGMQEARRRSNAHRSAWPDGGALFPGCRTWVEGAWQAHVHGCCTAGLARARRCPAGLEREVRARDDDLHNLRVSAVSHPGPSQRSL
jgi:hypothetical protein